MKTKITNNIKSILFAASMVLTVNTTHAQTQKGADIDGEAAGDESGHSVSMPDANTIAIGAYRNDGNGENAGHVRIYQWNGTIWTQKGADIDGEAAGDRAGYSVSMPDVNTIAIGAPYNEGNGTYAGHVRIYQWNGTVWTQKGADIDGEAFGDESGHSVSMPDANTIAIGALRNDGNGTSSGHVRIYQWDGTIWTQKGANIDGEAAGDQSGNSVSMPDANTIAIGAFRNDGNGADAGQVRIYQWNGTIWTQKGADIDGEAAGDNSGHSISMPDANTIAIGAFRNDGNGTDAGQVRIYQWNGTIWTQKGTDIDGEAAGDNLGYSVSMPDANTIAIGAPYNDGNGTTLGRVRIFQWNGTIWAQKGANINGETAFGQSGHSVCMPDANTIAIGAPFNGISVSFTGHVQVYDLSVLSVIDSGFESRPKVYPNPTNGTLTINLNENYNHTNVIVRNTLGQEVLKKSFAATNLLQLNIPGEVGVYFLEINAAGKKAFIRVIKR